MVSLIVILDVPKNFENLIKKIKRIVARKYNNTEYLEHPPHLTIFLGKFLENKTNKIGEELTKITHKIKSFDMLFSGPTFFEDKVKKSRAIIFVSKKNKHFTNLQKEVITNLNRYRDKKQVYDFVSSAISRLSKEEKKNVKKYGYPYSWNNFIPHIGVCTVTKNFDEIFSDCKKHYRTFRFKAKSLSLYNVEKTPEFSWVKTKTYKFGK